MNREAFLDNFMPFDSAIQTGSLWAHPSGEPVRVLRVGKRHVISREIVEGFEITTSFKGWFDHYRPLSGVWGWAVTWAMGWNPQKDHLIVQLFDEKGTMGKYDMFPLSGPIMIARAEEWIVGPQVRREWVHEMPNWIRAEIDQREDERK